MLGRLGTAVLEDLLQDCITIFPKLQNTLEYWHRLCNVPLKRGYKVFLEPPFSIAGGFRVLKIPQIPVVVLKVSTLLMCGDLGEHLAMGCSEICSPFGKGPEIPSRALAGAGSL